MSAMLGTEGRQNPPKNIRERWRTVALCSPGHVVLTQLTGTTSSTALAASLSRSATHCSAGLLPGPVACPCSCWPAICSRSPSSIAASLFCSRLPILVSTTCCRNGRHRRGTRLIEVVRRQVTGGVAGHVTQVAMLLSECAAQVQLAKWRAGSAGAEQRGSGVGLTGGCWVARFMRGRLPRGDSLQVFERAHCPL